MPIKAGFTFAELVARLTRGYIKATGQQPDNLAKIKINMEAAEKVKQQNKVINVDFNPNEKWWEARPGETGGITGIGPQADTIKGIDKRIQGRVENIEKILTDEKKTLDEFKKLDKKPTPIKKFLTDDEATAQIEKLKGDLPFMERMDVLQLLDDIDAGKAYGAFDDVQRKELRDAISRIYTNKPDFASGGIARVGFSKGKLAKGFFEFVEGLFIKASNDIRQGKGKWAGLDQKQRMVQHDNLTKMVTQWQKTKQLPEGAEQYFGVDAKKVFTQMNEKKDDILKNLTHDFKGKPYKDVAQTIEGTVIDERTLIKTKYLGISDDLLDQILVDANPQRKADVMTTLDQYLKLREVGKGEQEAFDIIKKSVKKIPTKHAEGGIAGELHLNQGGRVSFTKGGKVSSGLAHVLGV